ncbi:MULTISPECIES: glycogen/starch/alpha-glucan phosphorylase [Mesobacillus]|uniref:Alpha-1,4 glucan phosphorylase n=2 Tax=Mesobacillus TaxID=2675231 RepID=A0A0D6Z6K2_9BACI|nr:MULTISPECIES: glycogen/starch/alpha-glucan phosphorylase [Mesobacillus]KIY20920.1 maltodextrin phosphorylase [Mesobacillus subterraneus]MDQ0413110.1 starch phosphorylase [Mesobacillus stamsii]
MFSSVPKFKTAFLKKLEMMFGTSFEESTSQEQFQTLGHMIREYVSADWIQTNELYRAGAKKQVYYLSIEFLLGRLLRHNLLNLGVEEVVCKGLRELGIELDQLEEIEADAGLGNGGLGRLAACFLDSLASLDLPGHGLGIRYKHGLFEQKIVDGYQVELPEQWLRHGHVWEVRKTDDAVEIPFWGEIETRMENGRLVFRHLNAEPIMAIPYDLPVIGYHTQTVNTLRLWNAEPARFPAHADIFKYKKETESVSEFLYPDDTHDEGKILRLKQQYFLVAASLKAIVKSFKKKNKSLLAFQDYVSIHINDTHPAIAVPELMRILMDDEGLGWDEAWRITVQTLSYTNHTTLAEALERWPLRIFQPLLPRIFMIIEEINERFCKEVWKQYPGDWDRVERMAVIAHGEVRMAPLAIVGSHSINGVAKLHTEILKNREMNLFYQFYPERFNNKTNGITHRRWLLKANPGLSGLITDAIGPDWIGEPHKLAELMRYNTDSVFLGKLHEIKQRNKERLAKTILDKTGIEIDTESIFDVQVKRLHAYKRQLLNVLHIMHLYNELKKDPDALLSPRTFIFGAKASPGYYFAKKVIKLINSVADKVNKDPATKDKLKVVFLENYRVSLAEEIFPAADISEQISTASKEASGTGNMKFMMNGALTLGTLDGANVEITERVGRENIFLFGLSAEEVLDYQNNGGYHSLEYYHHDARIREIVDQLVNGFFPDTDNHFNEVYDTLLGHNDQYFVLKDFASYAEAHLEVSRKYLDRGKWLRMSLVNIAQSGYFSSDRTVREYADDIWKVHSALKV